MDMDEINSCKRQRSGGAAEGKIGRKGEEEEDGEADTGITRTKPWHQHHSSRIFRVSRASGGKDRHSKVLTSKGLRDRRVRLSVSTAIQFYDLQDRLGYDQPSKAVEWLIKAASAAIAELPLLDATFPDLLNKHLEPEAEAEKQQQPPQRVSHSRSGCSSTSETSKGSVLSLSRSEIRVKARERARERVAKDHVVHHHDGVNPGLDAHSSFTELLTGGGVQKQIQGGVFGQANYGNIMMMPPFSTVAAGDQQEMQQFPFLQEHLVSTAMGDFGFNFGISPGLSGCNRGTLQSNSPSQLPNHHHHLQRLSSPVDGSNLSFFFGGSGPESQFSAGLDGRLQLCYGNGYRHSDLKGKEKG